MAAFECYTTILNASTFTASQKGLYRFRVVGNGGNICAIEGGIQ